MDFDIQSTFHLLGLAVCVCSAIYLIYKKQKLVGSILLVGFVFILQANLYIHFIGLDPNQGKCWAAQGDYYQCQPIIEKLVFYASHSGFFLLALGVFILGCTRKSNDQKYS